LAVAELLAPIPCNATRTSSLADSNLLSFLFSEFVQDGENLLNIDHNYKKNVKNEE
jgi:hypothetical protein